MCGIFTIKFVAYFCTPVVRRLFISRDMVWWARPRGVSLYSTGPMMTIERVERLEAVS